MRTILLLIFMLASSLLFSTLAFAQSATSTRTRLVKGQVLTSSYLPPIRVKFDKAFTYLGTQNFVLYGRAQVEQYFFVAADSQRLIKRPAHTIMLLQRPLILPGRLILRTLKSCRMCQPPSSKILNPMLLALRRFWRAKVT